MTNQLTIKTMVIATMLLMLVDSSIAIGLLVGVTVLSVSVFGATAYAVASRKTKDKDSKLFEIRTPVPSFFSRNFPRTYMPRSGHP